MTEAVDTKHPDYLDRADEWRLMRDSDRGETAIKSGGTLYLPKPNGFTKQPDGGTALYEAYQRRAQFPEIVQPAVMAMVGVIHQAEIKIVIPDSMAGLWEKATADGLPLEAFHRRITAELLLMGRYSVLVDAPSSGDMPRLAGYQAETLINWAEDRTMFVLDESGLVRNGFQWENRKQYLALTLEDGRYVGRRYDEGGIVIDGKEGEPTTAKGDNLTEIPFVVMGPRDLSLKPETSPCIGIARAAKSIYQLSADYRWSLFMAGQETLFIINGDRPEVVGSGVIVEIKGGGDGNPPDAKYVGPAGTGIAAHRTAIVDEQQNAASAGARLFNSGPASATAARSLLVTSASSGDSERERVTDLLAAAAIRQGERVLLIDANVERGRQDAGRGLMDILRGESSLDEAIQFEGGKDVALMSGGRRKAPPQKALGRSFAMRMLADASRHFDVVIADAGALTTNVTIAPLVGMAEEIVLVAQLHETRLADVAKAVEAARIMGRAVTATILVEPGGRG